MPDYTTASTNNYVGLVVGGEAMHLWIRLGCFDSFSFYQKTGNIAPF